LGIGRSRDSARGASEVVPIVISGSGTLLDLLWCRHLLNGGLLLRLLYAALLLLLEVLQVLLVLLDGDLMALNEEISIRQPLRVSRQSLLLLRRGRLYKLLLLLLWLGKEVLLVVLSGRLREEVRLSLCGRSGSSASRIEEVVL
jgi:hypothetical protein